MELTTKEKSSLKNLSESQGWIVLKKISIDIENQVWRDTINIDLNDEEQIKAIKDVRILIKAFHLLLNIPNERYSADDLQEEFEKQLL